MKTYNVIVEEYSSNSGKLASTTEYSVTVDDNSADDFEFLLGKIKGEWTEVKYSTDGGGEWKEVE